MDNFNVEFNRPTLGIIAGSGDLPIAVISSALNKNYRVCICQIGDNNALQLIAAGHPLIRVDLGEIGKAIGFFKQHSVTEIVFAGAVKRPSISELKLDSVGVLWALKLSPKLIMGDNALLSAIIKLVAAEGFTITKPSYFLNDLTSFISGALTLKHPNNNELNDIKKGQAILQALSPFDIGQACVILGGQVLAIETLEGTDLMLCNAFNNKKQMVGGVLIKLPKKAQNALIDLPTTGLQTLTNLKNLGFSGMAIDSQNTQIIDSAQVIKFANENNLFIYTVVEK